MDERVGRIVSPERLMELRDAWRRDAKRIVLAGGAFELLHPGHLRLIEQARSFGDILVVAVVDHAVIPAGVHGADLRASPPHAPPLVPISERAEILAAMAAVDFVTALPDVSASSWIERFQPDVRVKGDAASSETRHKLTRPDERTRTVGIPREPGYSTALLIERIQQLRQ